MLTDSELFCDICQVVKELCPGHVSPHTLSVTEIPRSENGDTGDSALSPGKHDVTSTSYAAVTAVTGTRDRTGRHARNGDSSGDSYPSPVTAQPPQRRTFWTAADLLAAEFPPPKWAVPGIFPEGLTMLAGPPKVGKSWLSLGLAVAVSAGGKAIGTIGVEAGAALYLALEDNPRRLQSRLRQVLAENPAPDCLDFGIEAPALNSGLLFKLAEWVEGPHAHPPRLIIIDVFAKIRGPVPQGMSAYNADYKAMSQIKEVADAYQIGVIVIHHVRKGSAEDFLDEISGTNGLAGACDTIGALKRSRGELDGILHITGRDVEEAEYALSFNPKLGTWHLMGLASDYGLSETRRKILAYLRQHEGSKPAEIAMGTGLSRDLVKQTCNRMADDNQLDDDGHGRYFVPATKDAP